MVGAAVPHEDKGVPVRQRRQLLHQRPDHVELILRAGKKRRAEREAGEPVLKGQHVLLHLIVLNAVQDVSGLHKKVGDPVCGRPGGRLAHRGDEKAVPLP